MFLPLIAAGTRTRAIAAAAFAIIHLLISQWFNFFFVYGKPNWMDDLWGLKGQSAWDGGFFGVIGWAIPMLLGTIVYDIMTTHTASRATARILVYGALLMGVGYALNCLATLYDTDKGSVEVIGDVAASPVIPPFANAEGRALDSLCGHASLCDATADQNPAA